MLWFIRCTLKSLSFPLQLFALADECVYFSLCVLINWSNAWFEYCINVVCDMGFNVQIWISCNYFAINWIFNDFKRNERRKWVAIILMFISFILQTKTQYIHYTECFMYKSYTIQWIEIDELILYGLMYECEKCTLMHTVNIYVSESLMLKSAKWVLAYELILIRK